MIDEDRALDDSPLALHPIAYGLIMRRRPEKVL
jgi:hypothetical protein